MHEHTTTTTTAAATSRTRVTYAETRPLFERYASSRELTLRNHLVEQYSHIGDYHARRYAAKGVSRDDLRQVAMLGVLYAVERFDPHLGVSFATFASRTVDGECKRYLRDRTWTVKPPRSQQELYLDVRRTEAELGQELGRSPAVTEIAARIGSTDEQVVDALDAGNARHADELPHDSSPAASGGPERTNHEAPFDSVDLRLTLQGVVDRLDSRDRRIVELRFGRGWTEARIATELGVSQSYMSRHLRRILRQLRRMLDEQEHD